MSRDNNEPAKVDEKLLAAGIQAIADGDYAGAADALRVAKEIQEAAEKNAPHDEES